MMDDAERLLSSDEQGFFAGLAALPHSYDGPDGIRDEPYGLLAYGEASSLPHIFTSWVDAPVVVSGTQFLLAGGFDYGDAAPMKLGAELGGARVVMLGHGVHEPSLRVPPHAFSTYSYAGYLAHATGHARAWEDANRRMYELSVEVAPRVETALNPAKMLAWNLWNRVPLLVAARQHAGLPDLVQRVLGRVGKALSVPLGEHPLEALSGALESRHQLGDDMVGLVLGTEDDEVKLARELLSSRVAQVETLALPGAPPEDAGAHNLALWYLSVWVAGYLAALNAQEAEDSAVYRALQGALPLDPDADEDEAGEG